MPASSIWSRISRRRSDVAPTQLRWAIASIPSSCLIHPVSSTVRSRVDPPAPYVTETKSGCSEDRVRNVPRRVASPSSVFGGKNSKEKTGSSFVAMISSIRMVEKG